MKKNKVLASRFIEWYYNDHDDIKQLGYAMLHSLKQVGQCSLSVQEVFDSCDCIPKYICEDNDGVNQYTTDYNTDEIELINDFKPFGV